MDSTTTEQITLREILTLHQLRTLTEYPQPYAGNFSEEVVSHSWERLSVHSLIQDRGGKIDPSGVTPKEITPSGQQRLKQLEEKHPDE